MSDAKLVRPASKLTHEAGLLLVRAATAKASAMGVPQVIAVVDDGCNLLTLLRMDASRLLSIDIVTNKAMTAASTGLPTGDLTPSSELKLGLASDGRMTNLKGGLPIIVDGQVIGGIGVGSGTGDQDREVAQAAIDALLAALA